MSQNKLPEYFFCTYRLQPGDVIKFGKIRYKVLEANTSVYRKEQAKNTKTQEVYQQEYPEYDSSSLDQSSFHSSFTQQEVQVPGGLELTSPKNIDNLEPPGYDDDLGYNPQMNNEVLAQL